MYSLQVINLSPYLRGIDSPPPIAYIMLGLDMKHDLVSKPISVLSLYYSGTDT